MSNSSKNIQIFVVDDETAIRQSLEGVLSDEDYKVSSFPDAPSFFKKLKKTKPSMVLLDIWLPGSDGIAVLAQLRKTHPEIPVIMMSGHAGIQSAVNAIKLGAADFLEKPLDLDVLVGKISEILTSYKMMKEPLVPEARAEESQDNTDVLPGSAELVESKLQQLTLRGNVVLNGTGLLSGRKTGIIVNPLEPNSGIVFQALDGTTVPGHISALENLKGSNAGQAFTANSTVLVHNNHYIRTVEHLMASLSMAGISNVLITADEEIPNIDGSATDFCTLINDAGVAEQEVPRQEIVIHKLIQVGIEDPDEKYLYIEPYDGFEVSMRINYPAPIFEQQYTFNAEKNSFEKEIAPARSFNTFENIDMAQKMGKVGSGYLNSHIIIHDGKVINTELRYPDEFVRHKILDLIGDLYLVGYPLRGRVVANMVSHGYNQALAQKIHLAMSS